MERNKIIILSILLIILVAGCNKNANKIENKNNELIFYQTKYDSCQEKYNLLYQEKIQNYEQLSKCSQELANVNNFVENTIQWNNTLYDSLNNMSYTETATATKVSFIAALLAIGADLCSGLALYIFAKENFWKKWILCVSFVSFIALAVILAYIGRLWFF